MNKFFCSWQAKVVGSVALFTLGTGNLYAGEVLDRISRTGQVVLTTRDSIPFSYPDAHGQPIGYTVDICLKLVDSIRANLKRPDLKVKFIPVNPGNRFKVIVDGNADLECTPSTNNADRRKLVDFTIGNFIAGARMMVKSNSGIKNWPDLRDKTITTTKGTTNAHSIAERNDVRALNVKIVEFNDDPEAFQSVIDGKANAFAMDDVLLYGVRARTPNPDSYAIVGDPLTVEQYAVSFSKSDPDFGKVINIEMARIIQSGEIYGLYKKWFNSPIPPNGMNLKMPMNSLLRQSFEFPTVKTSD